LALYDVKKKQRNADRGPTGFASLRHYNMTATHPRSA